MEQDENHEKGPRWSWARNHMGNVSLHVCFHLVFEFWIHPALFGL
jgi:hypothetical protein